MARIRQLGELRDDGHLTDREFSGKEADFSPRLCAVSVGRVAAGRWIRVEPARRAASRRVRAMYRHDMTRVVIVAASWSKVVDIESADDVIDAEGMSWEREGLHDRAVGVRPPHLPPDLPMYVPSVGA